MQSARLSRILRCGQVPPWPNCKAECRRLWKPSRLLRVRISSKQKLPQASKPQAPETLTLQVNGKDVVFLTPSSVKTTDLIVKMEPMMIQAVFDDLVVDCEAYLGEQPKRSYHRTGKYRGKRGRGENESAEEEES